ncbi:uncharacterized protein B0I36DRAFT_253584 [Microdochium trichocladiopsis]|uniref:Chromatin structure-remodeling complex subunit RSC1 n=1 Tax=Microdochium trichocladiopsis TaxID=1682393 RepID=A0A9P9BH75_9PEZI|nr:uncharacterized protein B0I36DRAFT_253584 [Microdochium trichocladiopsis]KAH7018194.1 hypothetical protein B0I36DRAFT_253584 [Microdochium trichocladiopsis]
MKDADAGSDADADADADGEEDESVAVATGASTQTGARDQDEANADADGDEDGDEDAEGEPEDDDDGGYNSSRDMLMIIENTANYLSTYREPNRNSGEQIATGFQRIPNRRLIPDYYDVIQEPIAFSTIRTKRSKKEYTKFSEFVRDVALIAHNAQVYNRPSSSFFQYAGRLREVFKEELKKMVDEGTITAEEAVLPDLGEIPDTEDSPPPDDEADEEGEDAEEEDEEDDDSDNDEQQGRTRRDSRGRRVDVKEEEDAKKRARPPKVFTPLEARIHSLLKGLRRYKDSDGELLINPFEKLPDRTAHPDYYTVIQNPISLHEIKRSHKRKKYASVDDALRDLELMFENAKEYNEEGSDIYEAAAELQRHSREIAEQEKSKPDNAFADEDGRRPVSEIAHNGDIWRVGDWVHITNPNDLTKPIVAQIYRTWEDKAGQKWVNACWYYRPEQTVHRAEKHFYESEVVKTGQYRDHRIQEVIDRCFVMFVTRFPKGRPRGLPKDKSVYVCEARYNEERHRFAKIKTWASCIPDEVREKDYQMDLFDQPRRLKKLPSPIKHLLRDDAKPTDPMPKPTWGAANAPPLIGAVHCRERESNESPPPEPTPPPQPRMDTSRRPSAMMAGARLDHQGDVAMGNAQHYQSHLGHAPPTPTPGHMTNSFAPQFAPARPANTPVPVSQYNAHQSPAMHNAHPHGTPQAPHFQPHQAQHYNGYQQPQQYSNSPVPPPQIPQYAQQPQHYPPQQNMGTPVGGYDTSQRLAPSPSARSSSMVQSPAPIIHHQQPQPGYTAPRAIEVYHLADEHDAQIPEAVRSQLQRDEAGRVIFFTQPPLLRPHAGLSAESAALGHSARYLADRAREVEDRRAKRKARDELRSKGEDAKRAESEAREAQRQKEQDLIDLAGDMFKGWVDTMDRENEVLKRAYEGWSVRDEVINGVISTPAAATITATAKR